MQLPNFILPSRENLFHSGKWEPSEASRAGAASRVSRSYSRLIEIDRTVNFPDSSSSGVAHPGVPSGNH